MASKSKKPAAKAKPVAKPAVATPKASNKSPSSVVSFTDFTKNLGQQFSDKFSGGFTQDQFQMPNFNFMENFMSPKNNPFEKMSSGMTEEMTAASRQQIEALTKCSATLMKGFEMMMKTSMQMAQDSAEKNSEAMKNLMACKTMTEVTEAQNKLAQQNFDDMIKSATQMSEMCVKLCSEAFEPVNAQLTKSIKKASEAMAA